MGIYGASTTQAWEGRSPCWGAGSYLPRSTHNQHCAAEVAEFGRVTRSTHLLTQALTRHLDTGSPCPAPPHSYLASQEASRKGIPAHNAGCQPRWLPLTPAWVFQSPPQQHPVKAQAGWLGRGPGLSPGRSFGVQHCRGWEEAGNTEESRCPFRLEEMALDCTEGLAGCRGQG